MTDTNHYTAAVTDLELANDCSSEDPLAGIFTARAQVHATLALVDAIQDLNTDAEGTAFETVPCRCDQLVQCGSVCATCGHFAQLHGPHDGPCSVLIAEKAL